MGQIRQFREKKCVCEREGERNRKREGEILNNLVCVCSRVCVRVRVCVFYRERVGERERERRMKPLRTNFKYRIS